MIPTRALSVRALTAVIAVPAVVWVVAAAPASLFFALVIAIAAFATHELTALFERAGLPTLGAFAVVSGTLVAGGFLFPGGPAFALVITVMMALASPLWRPGPLSAAPAAFALLAVVYVDWTLGHAIWLHGLAAGPALVLVMLGSTWIGETTAYLVGSSIGRHKLAPVVSPNKTIEGGVGQVIASVAAAVALGAWLVPGWSATACAGGGLLIGVVGQVGDLAESAIKRSANAKDAGGLIPGHGGVLDRMDSLIFNVPAFFYYAVWVGGRP